MEEIKSTRSNTRVIGGDVYALVSGPEQEDLYVDPWDLAAVIGPSNDRYNVCNIYLDNGLHFTTTLGIEEISNAINEAKAAAVKSWEEEDNDRHAKY